MNGHSHIQWKFAMARMQAANLAATEISEQGEPIRRAIRKIAEQHLDRYFELVEAELNDRRKLYAEGPKYLIGARHETSNLTFPLARDTKPSGGMHSQERS